MIRICEEVPIPVLKIALRAYKCGPNRANKRAAQFVERKHKVWNAHDDCAMENGVRKAPGQLRPVISLPPNAVSFPLSLRPIRRPSCPLVGCRGWPRTEHVTANHEKHGQRRDHAVTHPPFGVIVVRRTDTHRHSIPFEDEAQDRRQRRYPRNVHL